MRQILLIDPAGRPWPADRRSPYPHRLSRPPATRRRPPNLVTQRHQPQGLASHSPLHLLCRDPAVARVCPLVPAMRSPGMLAAGTGWSTTSARGLYDTRQLTAVQCRPLAL